MKKAQTMILIGPTRIQMQNHSMILYAHLDAHSIYLKKHLHFGQFKMQKLKELYKFHFRWLKITTYF